jgi:hypothetical protein
MHGESDRPFKQASNCFGIADIKIMGMDLTHQYFHALWRCQLIGIVQFILNNPADGVGQILKSSENIINSCVGGFHPGAVNAMRKGAVMFKKIGQDRPCALPQNCPEIELWHRILLIFNIKTLTTEHRGQKKALPSCIASAHKIKLRKPYAHGMRGNRKGLREVFNQGKVIIH